MINIKIDSKYKNFYKFFKNIKEEFLKSDQIITNKRNIIKLILYDDIEIVVKSFKIPHLLNKIVYRFLRDSKAKRSFLNAQKLIELGINTPTPIGYIEFFDPFLSESFYICKYFDFDFEIRDVLKDKNFSNREQILKEFIKFTYNLHQNGVYHIDYSPGNILIKQINNQYIFFIVDVNRMKFMKLTAKLRLKNLSKLSASLEDTEFLASEYAKVASMSKSFAINNLLFYHKKHQRYLKNKKKLKMFRI